MAPTDMLTSGTTAWPPVRLPAMSASKPRMVGIAAYDLAGSEV
jgi:hypothetical protein